MIYCVAMLHQNDMMWGIVLRADDDHVDDHHDGELGYAKDRLDDSD